MNPSPFEIAQNVAKTFGGSQERQKDLSAIDQILTQANESNNPQDVNAAMGQILSRVSPERQPAAMKILQDKMSGIKEQKKFENQQVLKQQALEEGRSFKQKQVEEKRGFETQEEERKKESTKKALIDQGLDPSLADLPPALANKKISEDIKKEEKQAKEAKKTEVTQRSFDRLVELTPKVGVVAHGKQFISGKTRENIGEFDSLTGALESELITLVNKGVLSNSRFRYITEQLLPKSSDTQARIRGKMKGLAIELNLDDSAITGKKKTSVKPSGKLTQDQKEERPPIGVFDL